MEQKLLLLGMLREQSMHGYQLNEFLKDHLGMSVHIKKPTAYYLLGKMEKDGWIRFKEEKPGNRPARRIYSITPEGEKAFDSLLRDSIRTYDPVQLSSDIYLAFVHQLPEDDVITLLKERRNAIKVLVGSVASQPKHTGFAQLIIDHQQIHLENELKWTEEIIKKFQMQHSDPRSPGSE